MERGKELSPEHKNTCHGKRPLLQEPEEVAHYMIAQGASPENNGWASIQDSHGKPSVNL